MLSFISSSLHVAHHFCLLNPQPHLRRENPLARREHHIQPVFPVPPHGQCILGDALAARHVFCVSPEQFHSHLVRFSDDECCGLRGCGEVDSGSAAWTAMCALDDGVHVDWGGHCCNGSEDVDGWIERV